MTGMKLLQHKIKGMNVYKNIDNNNHVMPLVSFQLQICMIDTGFFLVFCFFEELSLSSTETELCWKFDLIIFIFTTKVYPNFWESSIYTLTCLELLLFIYILDEPSSDLAIRTLLNMDLCLIRQICF